jgi:hypothetical protein
MTSELSFLLDLLLNHKLGKQTKEAITERIKEVEASYQARPLNAPIVQQPRPQSIIAGQQAPSILAKYPDLAVPGVPIDHEPTPVPITQIAQTPETMKALQDRRALIAQSMSGKNEPGRTSPKKIGRP